MAIDIVIPRIGWSMEKGLFTGWLKNEGDRIEPGDTIFSIEADKAVEDVISEESGVLHILPGVATEGEELRVGTVIATLLENGEAPQAAAPLPMEDKATRPAGVATPVAVSASPEAVPAAAGQTDAKPEPTPPAHKYMQTNRSKEKIIASPRAIRIAKELSVDLLIMNGSGRGGRIVERDVRESASKPEVRASRLSNISNIGVLAEVGEFVEILERLRETDETLQLQVARYQSLIMKLAALAYSKALLGARRALTVDVAYGYEADSGLTYRHLAAVNRKTLAELSAEIAGDAISADPATGEEAFGYIDLGSYGIDDYQPGVQLPSNILLCSGRLTHAPLCGTEELLRQVLRIGISFIEENAGFSLVASFANNLHSALKDPVLWIA